MDMIIMDNRQRPVDRVKFIPTHRQILRYLLRVLYMILRKSPGLDSGKAEIARSRSSITVSVAQHKSNFRFRSSNRTTIDKNLCPGFFVNGTTVIFHNILSRSLLVYCFFCSCTDFFIVNCPHPVYFVLVTLPYL